MNAEQPEFDADHHRPPRTKPDRLQGEQGYDSEPLRRLLRWMGIVPELAKHNTAHGSGMGKTQWVVEWTNAFLHGFGRRRRCLDRLSEVHHAFPALACSIICLRFLRPILYISRTLIGNPIIA